VGRQTAIERRAWVTAFTLVGLFSAAAVELVGQDNVPASEPAALSSATPLTGYRAYRRMHAVNEKFNHEAWLDAWTELDQRGFRYEIVSERGSETVLKKVLRKLLEREREIVAAGEAGRGELSTDNYRFEEGGRSADGARYVLLKPKREDVLLVDGRMVLDESGTEVRRVEGRLAKNPSFWTSLVNVIREFASLDGVRVPVSVESIAKIKMAGVSRMVVHYEYESINGRPVSATARRMTAGGGSGSR
jgi:hypothetical protein